MKQKIEWYREVLELEPGSRVFFPLAKLLAAEGEASNAVFTLKQGLLRHPDHVEARLLLVELLFAQDEGPELRAEIDGLGALFASYPGFWSAWSERLSSTPALHDAALAMRFFSAALQGKKVSWAAIIEQGLQNVLGSGSDPQETYSQKKDEPLPFQDPSAGGAPRVTDPDQTAVYEALKAPTLEHESEESEDAGEEAFSLRTRSMADVLAEQGDHAGALEIYQELLPQASGEESAYLQERIDALSTGHGVASPVEEAELEKHAGQPSEGTKLATLLESLADRLEARARQ